jgi:hypothetical protein
MITDAERNQIMTNIGLCLLLALQQCVIKAEPVEKERCIKACEELKNCYLNQDRSAQEQALLVAACDDCISAIRNQ